MYPHHVFIINTILLIIIIISRKTSTGEQRPLGCHNEQRLPPQLVSRRFHQSTECARLFNASSSSSWSPFKEFSTPMVICSANDVAANCHFYLRNLRTMSVTLANYCIQNYKETTQAQVVLHRPSVVEMQDNTDFPSALRSIKISRDP